MLNLVPRRRAILVGVTVLVGLSLASIVAGAWFPPHGLTPRLHAQRGLARPALEERITDRVDLRPFEPTQRRPDRAPSAFPRALELLWLLAGLGSLVALAVALPDFVRRGGQQVTLARVRAASGSRLVVGIAVALLVSYAALLRFEALFGRFGPIDHPRWAVSLQSSVNALAPMLRPSRTVWTPGIRGGDPLAYLRFAREMRGFYQAHVREPVFLAATRGFLAVLDNQDIAVGFASTVFGALLVLATWLLAREAFDRKVAFVAAALLAIEEMAMSWGAEGWRDETFSFFAVMTAWALVRLIRRPTLVRALLIGAIGGVAMLTRITSLLFLVPGIAAAAWLAPALSWRRRVGLALAASGLAAVLVAPYMVNCALAYGDPLYAINHHTRFYREREQVANYREPESAVRYAASEFAAHPVRTADTAIYGLTVFPFRTKFEGWGQSCRLLGPAVYALSAAGLFLFALCPIGRFLLLFLLVSLAPYAFTWRISGGGEWRFTAHAYPFYLAAAGLTLREALAWTYRAVNRLRTGANLGPPAFVRPTARALLIASSVTITLAVLLWVLPFWAIREGDRRGVREVIRPDDLRDSVVFVAGGWGQMESGCLQSGALVTRVLLPLGATDTVRAQLHVVAARSAMPGERVEVRVGGRTLGVALLLADNRNQWVDVVVPPDLIRPALTPLYLVYVSSGGVAPDLTGREPRYRLCSIALER